MSEGELSRVHERLDELFRANADQHGEIKQQLATIQAECKPCQALLARHETEIRGSNGNQGIKTRVALIEQEQKRIGHPARQAKRAQQTSIGAVVTAVVGAIWAIIASMMGK